MTDRADYKRQWQKNHPDSVRLANKKYRDKNLEKVQNYQLDWRIKNKEYSQIYCQTEKYKRGHKKANHKYRQTKNGKRNHIITSAKRQRNLNWIQLFENPFDESEIIEWHHINNTFVVAIPRDLHRLYYGKYHRENEMRIIEQIYGGIEL